MSTTAHTPAAPATGVSPDNSTSRGEAAAAPQSTAMPRSTRTLLAVVVVSVFVAVLTGSMVNVLIPLMRAEFAASTAQIGWIITAQSLAFAIGVPLFGRVSDVFGVRRVFAVGLLGFIAGSAICALAPSLPLLVAGRVVQGIGGAAIPAMATVAVAKVLPAGSRGGALGLISSTVGIGATAGPIIGGALGQTLGWRSLFIGSLLLMLIVLPISRRVLPDGGDRDERRFDIPGGVLLGLSAGLFLFGITQGQTAGFVAVSSWGCFLGAALAAAGFAWRISTAPAPFVSPALFRNRGYVAALGVGFFAMMANMSALVTVPLLLIEVNGLTPGAAGLVLTPGAAAVALLSPVSGRLSDRIGVRPPILGGLGLMALAFLYLSAFGAGSSPVMVAAGMFALGVGMAFIQSPASNAAANALPDSEVGSGMGIYTGTFFLGGGTGPALLGAFLAARIDADGPALNPVYALAAAPFSDTFLALTVAIIVALLFAAQLRGRPPSPAQP